jgi:hypothetical protein
VAVRPRHCDRGHVRRRDEGDPVDDDVMAAVVPGHVTLNLNRACVKRVLRPSPDPSDPHFKPYYEYIYTFKPFGC